MGSNSGWIGGASSLFHVTDHIERFVVDKDEIGGVMIAQTQGDLIDRLDVNARYHCVGKRGAADGEMESPGGGDVVYVPGHAGDQGRVFTTLNRRAKK